MLESIDYNLYIDNKITKQELAIKYNRSIKTIDRWLLNYNKKYDTKTISKEELHNLYINQDLSANVIANKLNITPEKVYNLTLKYNFKKAQYFNISKEELYDLYINQHLTQTAIAKKYNVSRKIIERKLNNYNIKEEFSKRYTQSYIPSKEELYNWYIKKNLTYKEINQLYKVTYAIFKKLCKEYNIKKYSSKSNEEIIQDYKYNQKPIVEIAKENHSRISKISKILKQNGISYLSHYSRIEHNIGNLFSEKFNIQLNTRILNGKEIDIYIPEKKIGIEFNGNYWHSEKYLSKNYHQMKSLLAEEKGIFLYHIFEYEWQTKQDKIINQLNNLLSLNDTKIYARKCIIKEVNNQEKKQFLESNHLQGNDCSSIKLGLYYQDTLVSLMTFCKPRFNKKYEWELSRFCCKANTSVIGGASKLFKYFINEYKPKNIISYSDIAKTKGNLYSILGFKLKHIAEPNYVWIKGNEILTRYQCQKYKLIKQGYKGASETDIMHQRGYNRLYDAGNKVWIWKNGIFS